MPLSARLAIAALLFGASSFAYCAGSVRFEHSGQPVLSGEPIPVVVHGLPANQVVELVASRRDMTTAGRTLQSRSQFQADAQGTLDTARQPSIGPSYLGTDASGPFWSMRPVDSAGTPPVVGIQLEAMVDGTVVGSDTRQLEDVKPEVVADPRLSGSLLYRPGSSTPLKEIVIILGGSEGENSTARAVGPRFARAGYAAFGLAYHSPNYGRGAEIEGLPSSFKALPLERIEWARSWLSTQPGLGGQTISLWGVSKGAEVALAAADRMPWIHSVVAVVPSDVAWAAFGPGVPGDDEGSGLSWQGAGLPWTPYRGMGQAIERISKGQPAGFRQVHDQGRLAHPDRALGARLGLKAKMPVLLIGGSDDQLWPSGQMSLALGAARLDRKLPTTVVVFDRVGHALSGDGWSATTWSGVGGDPQATAGAQRLAWGHTLDFLAQSASSGP